MNYLLTFFAVAFPTSSAVQAQGTNNNATNDFVRLRVTVMEVVQIRSFKGSLTPTSDVDPRFALTLRIDSCAPVITNLKPGTVITFAVHSPSRFLGGSADKGTVHEIKMPRTEAMNLVFDGKDEIRASSFVPPRRDFGFRPAMAGSAFGFVLIHG